MVVSLPTPRCASSQDEPPAATWTVSVSSFVQTRLRFSRPGRDSFTCLEARS